MKVFACKAKSILLVGENRVQNDTEVSKF